VFALPLLLDPYRWARAFGWRAEPETDVGLYFGRCLGAFATAACIEGGRAARDPQSHRSYFGFAEIAGWLLAAVHVRGLLERAASRLSSTLRLPAGRCSPPRRGASHRGSAETRRASRACSGPRSRLRSV
jgi:hypothetical protein